MTKGKRKHRTASVGTSCRTSFSVFDELRAYGPNSREEPCAA